MLDHAAIKALLPQRYPMLLLDHVDAYVPGIRVTARKAITASEPCYRPLSDRAPSSAYAFPVSLLLESFGQAAAIGWLLGMPSPGPQDRVLMLGGLRDCRIEADAFPGDVVRHEVRFGRITEAAAFGSGEAWVGQRRIATMGTFSAVIRPLDEVLAAIQRDVPAGGERTDPVHAESRSAPL